LKSNERERIVASARLIAYHLISEVLMGVMMGAENDGT
jgi:hypothetical protein